MSKPTRAVPRNPWPIIRFFAHSRPWASSRRRLALGEKSPKSATLRAKECERNRTDCRCRFGISIASCRRSSVLNSFNRGAADLGFFAVGNERHLNVHETEWRKRRPIGRIFRTVHRTVRWTVPFSSADFRVFRSKKQSERCAVRFRSLPLISAHSVVKNITRDDLTTKNSKESGNFMMKGEKR